MPYLRFFRDERGYEHTCLLHGLRTGSRPRLLYWFRTPPNVGIGRLPLDEDAIRAIEDANADLTFDWTRMLQVKPQPVPARAAGAADRRRSRGRPRRGARPEAAGPAAAGRPAASSGGEAAAAGPGGPGDASGAAGPAHPVAALVGGDGLARLRARYAELRARVAESGAEARVRERAAARVETLNPDGWRAGEEAVLGIERFEAAAAEIRADLGRRRRRSPRNRPGAPVAERGAGSGAAASD